MKKLLALLCVVSGVASATSLDMNNLYCGSMKLDTATTLGDVQQNCKIYKQKMITSGVNLGLYEVKLKNTATNKKVTCDFAESTPTAKLNGCR